MSEGKKSKRIGKGQISFAEYLVAVVVFIAFIGYFSFQLVNFLPAYLGQIRNERVRGEAYQLSELLINDPGFPINWHVNIGATRRIGLSDETRNVTNLISESKIAQLRTQCSGSYANVKNWMGSENDFSISITIFNSNTGLPVSVYNCVPVNPSVRLINTTIRRFAAINSTHFAELMLQVI
ncbi:MAG TPA: hypothetical protein VJJ76_01640 [archaeon]|nr:hypothetical protein [archaeon]